MKTPRYDLASGRHSRLWSSRLWVLAGLLGALTVFHMVAVVHDNRAWRSASHGVALATAEQHAERMNERLQLYALETFAPISRWQSVHPATAADGVDALVRAQALGEQCHCRKLLPVAEFFRVGSDGNIERRESGGANSARSILTDSALIAIARAQSANMHEGEQPAVRLTLGATVFDYAVLTTVAVDSASREATVYGLVANARTFMQSLFGPIAMFALTDTSLETLVTPDTLSLQVGQSDSAPLFGKLSPDRPFRARVVMHGPLSGLGVSVALGPNETRIVQSGLSRSRLWMLGVLTLCTLLVIVIAVGTSRREMFLARARSDFIAGTSHDLRMPLAQILLASETLTMRANASEFERASLSRSIVRETRRLIGMVENVLLYSRSGAVVIKPALQPLNVGQLFDDVVESAQLAIDDADQSIAIAAEPDIVVMADRQLLRQAVVNLVENAIKYGKPHQQIQLAAKRASGGLVHLWVDDQGPGIPPSQRARVFEPYERLERDQASERAGSGLGLAVVYHIASICGGRAWIEDAPGGGARVLLELRASAT